MTDFQVGDEVQITIKGKVTDLPPWGQDYLFVDGDKVFLGKADVEVLTPKDDPAKDLPGTLRQSKGNLTPYVKLATNHWQHFAGDTSLHRDAQVRNRPIVGTVPGTPAAQAQKPAEPLVVNYGDTEPDRGKMFKESYAGYLWSYREGTWRWSNGEGYRWLSRGTFATVLRDEFPWVEVVS